MAHQQSPSQVQFSGQNPITPQTDLIALKGAKDVLVTQQNQLSFKNVGEKKLIVTFQQINSPTNFI